MASAGQDPLVLDQLGEQVLGQDVFVAQSSAKEGRDESRLLKSGVA
jgi:hypothetical protein